MEFDIDNKEAVATLIKMAEKYTKDTTLIYEIKSHISPSLSDCANSRQKFNDFYNCC
jgi:hypothetical protein